MKPLSTLTKAASAVAAIGTIVGAAFVIDARYAHADTIKRDMKQMSLDLRIQLTTLRVQTLEDRLFELETKVVKTPHDDALISRFKRQLFETQMVKP